MRSLIITASLVANENETIDGDCEIKALDGSLISRHEIKSMLLAMITILGKLLSETEDPDTPEDRTVNLTPFH